MRIITTDNMHLYKDDETVQCIYNGLDSLLTHEIFGVIKPQLRPDSTQLIYDYERKMLGPILTMERRGIQVDKDEARRMVNGIPDAHDPLLRKGLLARLRDLGGLERVVKKSSAKWIVVNEDAILQQFARIVWDKPLNYHSEKQMKEFFYGALGIPPITIVKKGERKVSCNREALEKLQAGYVRAMPMATCIMKLRDLEKYVEVLTRNLAPGNRWAAGYNVAGTDSGRWSSSDNPLGYASNIQNIDPELRRVFVSDPGYVFVQCDQQGAEARAVAYLSGDENYIRAVESGDVHTYVASLTWGFEPRRELAERKFYRDKSYRDMAKKLTHGSSYLGGPRTIAGNAKCEVKLVEDFQRKFFKAFPGIKEWHFHTITELQKNGYLLTPFGMRRQFWSRLNDDATWRAAIAFNPQHIVGYLTGIALYRLWHSLEPQVQILANGHDAAILQIPEESLDKLLPRVVDLLKIDVPITDIKGTTRTLTIPWDGALGFNWGKNGKDNPQGLMELSKWHKIGKFLTTSLTTTRP